MTPIQEIKDQAAKESRFYIDERAGCIAVRDREHPYFNPEYQGLHQSNADVIFYAHGFQKEGVWNIHPYDIQKAKNVCEHLNRAIELGIAKRRELERERIEQELPDIHELLDNAIRHTPLGAFDAMVAIKELRSKITELLNKTP